MLKGSVYDKSEHPDDTLTQRAPDHPSRLGDNEGSKEATVERLMNRFKNVCHRISGIYQLVAYVPKS